MPDANTSPHVNDLRRRVAALEDPVRTAAAKIDRDGALPEAMVSALREAGLFRMCAPSAYGGLELDPPTIVEVVEQLARIDASTAWVAMIGATGHMIAAYLPEAGADEVYADGPDIAIAGLLMPPSGRALRVAGGYEVTGRWPFGSAGPHSAWFFAPCVVHGEDGPVLGADGQPEVRMVFVPAHQVTLHDTWHVAGLRGTGSHDYEIDGVFVPEARSFRPLVDGPVQAGALYRMPNLGLGGGYMPAVAVGVSRGAIEAFRSYAESKTVNGEPLTALPATRARVGEAEAITRAARAFVLEQTTACWKRARRGEPFDDVQLALNQLAATHAFQTCSHAVDLMYTSGGATSLFDRSPLQRHLRDIQAAKQHTMVAFRWYELAGETLLDARPERVARADAPDG